MTSGFGKGHLILVSGRFPPPPHENPGCVTAINHRHICFGAGHLPPPPPPINRRTPLAPFQVSCVVDFLAINKIYFVMDLF